MKHGKKYRFMNSWNCCTNRVFTPTKFQAYYICIGLSISKYQCCLNIIVRCFWCKIIFNTKMKWNIVTNIIICWNCFCNWFHMIAIPGMITCIYYKFLSCHIISCYWEENKYFNYNLCTNFSPTFIIQFKYMFLGRIRNLVFTNNQLNSFSLHKNYSYQF